MKKFFALVLALILLPCAALAEIDLSSLSFSERQHSLSPHYSFYNEKMPRCILP